MCKWHRVNEVFQCNFNFALALWNESTLIGLRKKKFYLHSENWFDADLKSAFFFNFVRVFRLFHLIPSYAVSGDFVSAVCNTAKQSTIVLILSLSLCPYPCIHMNIQSDRLKKNAPKKRDFNFRSPSKNRVRVSSVFALIKSDFFDMCVYHLIFKGIEYFDSCRNFTIAHNI